MNNRTTIPISQGTKQVLEALRDDFLKVKGIEFPNLDRFIHGMCIFTRENFIDVDESDDE